MKFDKRDFRNIDEHDEFMIKMCMNTLRPGDNFYYLGDFSFTNPRKTESYLATLQSSGANLFFIKGNHDKRDTIKLYQKYGIYLGEQKTIQVLDGDARDGIQNIVLNHYAMRVWDRSHHGTWHLYGHSHHTLPELSDSMSFDVGINGWDYQLISYQQVKEKMSKKTYKPIDHHGKTGRI